MAEKTFLEVARNNGLWLVFHACSGWKYTEGLDFNTIYLILLTFGHFTSCRCRMCVFKQMPRVETQWSHGTESLLQRLFTMNKVIRDNSLLLFPVKRSWMLRAVSLSFTPSLDMCVCTLVCLCVYTPLTVILAYLTELWPSLLDNYSKWVFLFWQPCISSALQLVTWEAAKRASRCLCTPKCLDLNKKRGQ